MKTVKFFGASDDLIEISGVPGADEFYADMVQNDEIIVGKFILGGKMRVYAMYTDHGLWTFAVSQIAEGVSLPDWPIRVIQSPEKEYSIQLEIDVPDDVALFREA